MDELFLVINNDIIGYRITCLQIMEYFEASFIFLTDSMVSFFSSHWISWTSCHFWTIFLIIGAIRSYYITFPLIIMLALSLLFDTDTL